MDATNNRVGVKTTIPTETLQVVGNGFFSGGSSSIYFNSLTSASNYMRIFHIQTGVFTGGYIDWLGGDFHIRDGLSGVDELTLSSAGVCTLAGGLNLPTSGGTVTTLNYYEESTQSLTFGWTDNSGTTATVSCKFSRIGNQVQLLIPSFSVNCGNASRTDIRNSVAFPARFRPATRTTNPMVIRINAVNVTTKADVLSTGFVYMFQNIAEGQFQFAKNGPAQSIVYNGLFKSWL